MVTSYYIMKMSRNKQNINTEEYYSGLQSPPKLAVYCNNKELKCRVCLQGGDIPITNDENFLDIKEALKIFGDIDLSDDDKNLKQLCSVCYKFLKSAILFRKIAHQTNKALSKPLKLESKQVLGNYLESMGEEKLNQHSNDQKKDVYFPTRKKEWSEPVQDDFLETIEQDKIGVYSHNSDKIDLSPLRKKECLEQDVQSDQEINIDVNKSNKYSNGDNKINLVTASKECYQHVQDDSLDSSEEKEPNKYLNYVDKINNIPSKKKEHPKHGQDYNLESTEENNSNDFLSINDDEMDLFPPKKEEPKIQCHTCKKSYSKRYYKIHLTLHNPDHSNQFVCDICGRSFRLRDSCYNHRLRHRPDYFYKCQHCPFKARYMGSLRSHMRTHTHKHRFACTECPAKFLYKSNLKTHILLKHKAPQFKCDKCDKSFHTKDYLQKHIDVDHLGIKRHVCTICGLAFGIRSALMKHQLRVHKREKVKQNYSKRSVINKAL